jgi:predicted cupin superfamily sugar epimerase/GNAT superfamily N-acetyltransferase
MTNMTGRIEQLIDLYRMIPMEEEGTLYHQSYRDKGSTAIIGLYSQTPLSYSRFHKLDSDEVWHFYSGDPFRLILLYPDGSTGEVIMGSDPLKGETIQYTVPAGVWQAGEIVPGGQYSLYGCTMSPGFERSQFTGGEESYLLQLCPERKEDIIRLACPDRKEVPVLLPRRHEDRKEVEAFYRETIADTFKRNGIDDPDGVKEEVKHQMETFDRQTDRVLLARISDRLVGTIACGQQNRSVRNNIEESLKELPEIKGVYVHPDYQSRGIGTRLWKTMLTSLYKEGVEKACLDSGYRLSQKYWTKKIGEPEITIKDYWGKGEHQMIWFFEINPLYKDLL